MKGSWSDQRIWKTGRSKHSWSGGDTGHMTVCSVAQPCLTPCNPMTCSPPGSSVLGISQTRNWSGLPLLSPEDLSDPGIKPAFLALAGWFFTTESPGKPIIEINRQGKVYDPKQPCEVTHIQTRKKLCSPEQVSEKKAPSTSTLVLRRC